jgi:hypothetical protein
MRWPRTVSESLIAFGSHSKSNVFMPIDPQSLYVQLGQLIATMPTFQLPSTKDDLRWMARACALLEASGDFSAYAKLQRAVDDLPRSYGVSAYDIRNVLYTALAKAELAAPVSAQGSFIPVGADFDGLVAVGKVLAEATSDALIVDPYLDQVFLTDFAASAPEVVRLRLLSDQRSHKATLAPAARRWAVQHGSSRPLDVRLTLPGALHDRLIIVDAKRVWSVTQSFKDLAARSPASIMRVGGDMAELKIVTYEEMWRAATPLLMI